LLGCTHKTDTGEYRFHQSDEHPVLYVPKDWQSAPYPVDNKEEHVVQVEPVVRLNELRFLYQLDLEPGHLERAKIILESQRGAYRHAAKVKNAADFESSWLTLVFPWPAEKGAYRLWYDPGDDSVPSCIFHDRDYYDLVLDPTEHHDGEPRFVR